MNGIKSLQVFQFYAAFKDWKSFQSCCLSYLVAFTIRICFSTKEVLASKSLALIWQLVKKQISCSIRVHFKMFWHILKAVSRPCSLKSICFFGVLESLFFVELDDIFKVWHTTTLQPFELQERTGLYLKLPNPL